MSKKTSYLLGISLTIVLGTIFSYFLGGKEYWDDQEKKGEARAIVVQESKDDKVSKKVFSAIDSKNGMSFNANDNFNFENSSFLIVTPLSEGLNEEVSKLSRYIIDNPKKQLEIIGNYKSNEQNNSAFPNLGLARAYSVKSYLVSQGIPSHALNIFGKLDDDIILNTNGIYYGPLDYNISTVIEGDTPINDVVNGLGKEIKANPLVIHFDIGNANIELSNEQRSTFAKIASYIDKADDKALIQIVGHTDDIGKRSDNIKLGLSRANIVKQYLVKNMILESKIETSSNGPDQPIAENNTKDGQSINRRVIVTIN